jgi:hypothetical protein
MVVRVTDDRGYPLSSVEVHALSLAPESPLRATRFSADDGLIEIPDVTGLPLRLEVTHAGNAPELRTLDSAPRELAITLRHGVAIAGDVRTRGGHEGLEGVELTLYSPGGARHAKTDGEGRYTVRDLAPGKARLTLAKKGFARLEVTITIPEGDTDRPTELDRIELAEAGIVEGEVVDKNGDPVVGARVACGSAPAYLPLGPLPPGVAVTDSHGRFTLEGVPEGNQTLEAYAAERGRGHEKARVTPGDTTHDVRIKLDEDAPGSEPASAGGVAITLGESNERGARKVVVLHVAAGSEAERGGLRPEDVLVMIDDHAPSSKEDARKKLSGPIGDDVVIRVLRDGDPQTLRVARERVRR